MSRKKTFEETMEEMGMGSDLPDTSDRYVGNLDKTIITEQKCWDISQKIERYMEDHIRKIKDKNEICQAINDLFDYYDVGYDYVLPTEFKYDKDKQIAKLTKKVNDQSIEKVTDTAIDLDFGPSMLDLNYRYIDEIHNINSELGCNLETIESRRWDTQFLKDHAWSLTLLFKNARTVHEEMRDDPVCKDVGMEELEKAAPLTHVALEHIQTTKQAKEKIKDRLEKSGRREECKELPRVEIDDFAIVTENPDLSFACNPWSDTFFSDDLKKRIEKAEKRVTIK